MADLCVRDGGALTMDDGAKAPVFCRAWSTSRADTAKGYFIIPYFFTLLYLLAIKIR
jgi:hypothetical protein